MREVRRKLTAAARLEPNYAEAVAAARELGFRCEGYKPRRLICRLLGFHVNVFVTRTCSGDGSWSINAHCCPIGGIHTPKRGARIPLAPPPRESKEPSLWSPGDSAFWLDPDLWNRTPMIGGRPDICWMHLDEPTRGERAAPPPMMRGRLSEMRGRQL
jgi:hypothetical protein